MIQVLPTLHQQTAMSPLTEVFGWSSCSVVAMLAGWAEFCRKAIAKKQASNEPCMACVNPSEQLAYCFELVYFHLVLPGQAFKCVIPTSYDLRLVFQQLEHF